MRKRLRTKLLAAAIPTGIAVLCTAGPSVAAGLGNGPSGPPRTPGPTDLSPSQPLIDVQFKNGKITGVTGTAVPKSMQKKPTGVAPRTQAKCSVNFTRSRKRVGNNTSVSWFGGLGCMRAMFLFGEATLNQSATAISGTGPHYQVFKKSAASGRNNTTVKAPNPSLYIVHLTNVFFEPVIGTGRITVYPAPGQRVNVATWCIAAKAPGHGLGVHCELYTDRF
jgi:hypothetical protein